MDPMGYKGWMTGLLCPRQGAQGHRQKEKQGPCPKYRPEPVWPDGCRRPGEKRLQGSLVPPSFYAADPALMAHPDTSLGVGNRTMTATLPLYNTDPLPPWLPCVPPLTVQHGAGLQTLTAQIIHVTEIKGHLLDRGSFQSVLIRDLTGRSDHQYCPFPWVFNLPAMW